jgi:hypothetical protein
VSYKLTVNLPNQAPGTTVLITGLGEFENGKAYEITDSQAATFRTAQGKAVSETDDKGRVTYGYELGPELTEARFAEGVTVEEVQQGAQEEPKSAPKTAPRTQTTKPAEKKGGASS